MNISEKTNVSEGKRNRLLRMPGSTVASEYVDLGRVEPTWYRPEVVRSQSVKARFQTKIDQDGSITILPEGMDEIGTYFLDKENINDENLLGSLKDFVTQIDLLYRKYREFSSDTVLAHRVLYRAGRARLRGSNFNIVTGNIFPISGPGFAHFDSFLGDRDAIILSRGGNPTRIFIGPVRTLGDRSIISRLLMPPSGKLPHDRAVMIDRHTLHKQTAQIHNPFRPAVFLRSTISVVQPPTNS